MAEVKYEVVKKIKVLSQGTKKTKELNLIKWGAMEPTYDIRKWEEDTPGKGITLTAAEAKELYSALGAELGV
ncbi:MAG: hypothetical protein IJR89_06535 [Clostridia bacterium]|nr:hypothetical protein [Clostridia bacterium]